MTDSIEAAAEAASRFDLSRYLKPYTGRQIIRFSDLLDTGPLTVHGISIDAAVDVTLSRQSPSAAPVIEALSIGRVYLHVDSWPDLIELDKSALTTRNRALWEAFETAVERHALDRAMAALYSAWNDEPIIDGP